MCEVVRGRARVERDRLALLDHRRGRAGDRLLAVRLKPQTEIESELRLPALQRPDPAADARHEALPGELREVVADGYLRDRKRFRKFRNVNGIAVLEESKHLRHALALRQIRHFL